MSRAKRIRRTEGTRADRRGAALVELGLLLPLFAMLVLGIAEFGRALSVSQLLSSAAREGARVATTAGSTNLDVANSVKSIVSSTLNIAPEQVEVGIAIVPAEGNPTTVGDVQDAQLRDLCEVTVQVEFEVVTYVVPEYLTGQKLIGHCAMRHE